jgi:uncharacterized protein YutE (UPF0331/DUF86 family)
MNQNLVKKKLEFMISRLETLAGYRGQTVASLENDAKTLKYVEKTIQELVDAAIDTNQHILETEAKTKPWSSKQSFLDLQKAVLQARDQAFAEDDIRLFVDSVAFRNEIVHSYDVSVYVVWAKRSISTIVDLYRKYIEKIRTLMN